MTDIVTLIQADHTRIRRLFTELDAARDSPSRLARLWPELAWLLRSHTDAAEEIFCLPLLAHQPDGLAALPEMIAGHTDIRITVSEADLHPAGSRLWWLAVRAARVAADKHIEAIESGPLPRFRRHVPEQDREALGRQWTAFMTARGDDDGGAAPTAERDRGDDRTRRGA
jgi:hypothetical protein